MRLRIVGASLLIFAVLAVSGYSSAFAEEMLPEVFEKAEVKPELFTIARFVVAKGVKDKEPVGVTERFPAEADKAYCYLEAVDIINDTRAECAWYLNGVLVRVSSLSLSKGARWRTYANKTINRQRGDWRVDLSDGKGNVFNSVSFKVE